MTRPTADREILDTHSDSTRIAALLAVHECATDAIVSTDERGTVLTFNPAAERLFGYTAAEIVGQSVNRLMPGPDADHHDQYMSRYLRTGEARIIGIGRDVTCRRRDGHEFVARLTIGASEVEGRRIFAAILHDLTIRRAAERRARALQNIIEHAGNPMLVVDREDLRLVYANGSARALFGGGDELVGRRLSGLIDADSAHDFSGAIRDLHDGDESAIDLRAAMRQSSGEPIPVEVHLFATDYEGRAACVASMHDISDRRRVELALRRKKLEQRLILRYAPIGIFILDRAGRILSVNHAAETICGRSESELIGQYGMRLLMDDDRSAIRRRFIELVAGNAPYLTSRHQLKRPDGEVIPVRTHNAVILGDRDEEPLLITMCEDLSDENRRSAELQEQRERLAHVGRLSQMGEMAAALAHELNQPLTAINTYAAAARQFLQKDGDRRSQVIETCERISSQAKRAGDVIRKIRSLTTPTDSEQQAFSINPVIEELQALFDIDARHTGVQLQLNLGPDTEIYADRVQIEQVILNFVRNAIDASAGLPAERRQITLATRVDGDNLRVEVADAGSGVDPAVRPRLFEPFVSGKSSGMGMGLSICKGIIEAHRGRIGVDDNTPHGATFWFTIPRAEDRRSAA